jgi:hypothetical protein
MPGPEDGSEDRVAYPCRGAVPVDQFSSKFPVPYASVSGVGDQARSFLQPLNVGSDQAEEVPLVGDGVEATGAAVEAEVREPVVQDIARSEITILSIVHAATT